MDKMKNNVWVLRKGRKLMAIVPLSMKVFEIVNITEGYNALNGINYNWYITEGSYKNGLLYVYKYSGIDLKWGYYVTYF